MTDLAVTVFRQVSLARQSFVLVVVLVAITARLRQVVKVAVRTVAVQRLAIQPHLRQLRTRVVVVAVVVQETVQVERRTAHQQVATVEAA